jgi:ATP-dependent RNA circularization protein (DNA/RNA ligase family)
MENYEFEKWLKEELSDIEVKPTKEEMVTMMMDFGESIIEGYAEACKLIPNHELAKAIMLEFMKKELNKAL